MSGDPGDPGPSTHVKRESDTYQYLDSLNEAQYKAVTAPPEIPLQILAGPGSGKTRVLTSRVAHLVRKHGYRPMEITAVTFTNKAANEMKKRLAVLLGPKDADALILGTFHATCAKYLRRYGQLIDLSNNFAITDADDCKKIMSGLIKARADIHAAAGVQLKDTAVLSEISKAKAREESPDDMAIRAASDPSTSTSTLTHIAELYAEYEAALRESNSLDFDDLLVFGLRLFRTAPRVIAHCRHILVDEFQDTNTTQYELMRCFANANGGLSVVGDPDQSIYGWRSAEIENLNKMTREFPGTESIYLEENYRSTGSILSAAHSVVSQDRERIQKSLFTSHPQSTAVTLKPFSTPIIESSFIATEIKRLIAYSGGTLGYDDFAILLRYNALSRTIESALQKDSIPNRIVGGHKFFERMEIKDLLAYLQLAENPGFNPAFLRVVNVPRRAIGDKSVADLVSAAKKEKISPMELCERIIDGDQLPLGVKPAIKKNLASFVGVVRKIRRAAQKGTSVADLLHMIIEKTSYEEHLRKTQQDFDSRWENVQELISYSVVVAQEQERETNGQISEEAFIPASSAAMEAIVNQSLKKEEKKVHPMFRRTSTSNSTSTEGMDIDSDNDNDSKPRKKRRMNGTNGANGSGSGKVKEEPIEFLDSDDDLDSRPKTNTRSRGVAKASESPLSDEGDPQALLKVDQSNLNPLGFFLQTSMLSTDTQSQEDEGKQPKVTITTVHSAKGLEWPVVFIPAVEQGTYPSYRCTEPHEVAEERRLLYVAMTRAQVFLTMSYCHMRMLGGEDSQKDLSEFVARSSKKDPTLFSANLPEIDETVRKNTAGMLGRPIPDEVSTKDAIHKHVRAAPPLSMWDAPDPQDRNFNRFARREITKATRAAEYWASESDEYALPGTSVGGSSSGFQSARTAAHAHARPHHRDRDRDRERGSPTSPAKPPPKPIKSKHVDIPAPLPFTFGKPDPKKTEQGLGTFTNASNNFLANLDSLGVGDGDGGGSGGSSTGGGGGGSLFASPSLDIGPPDLIPGPGAGAGSGLPSGGRVELAKGTKRLGMGRPAPWGAKR